MIRSSIGEPLRSSCGTLLSRTARTICADRSSGRIVLSEPFMARPMGLRAVATMTASALPPAAPAICSVIDFWSSAAHSGAWAPSFAATSFWSSRANSFSSSPSFLAS
jgi:hypothetical protein